MVEQKSDKLSEQRHGQETQDAICSRNSAMVEKRKLQNMIGSRNSAMVKKRKMRSALGAAPWLRKSHR